MTTQELINKINDETTTDEILIDLVELAESEKNKDITIKGLEDTVKEKDDKIRELKIDNHELMKKVVDSIELVKKGDEPKEPEIIKETDDILKGFLER